MNPLRLSISAIAVFAVAFGAWIAYRQTSPPPEPQTATRLASAEPLPPFSLLDQRGEPVGPEAFADRWNLVFFGFTHCPDVCPLTLQTLADAIRQLDELGQDPLPRIILVSVDPERDTPEILGSYLDHFGAGHLGITGDLAEIRKLTGALGIYFEKVPLGDGEYTVDHSAVVLVVNPRGEFSALFSAPHRVPGLVHDLPILMEQP